jgi:hypothetical protein
MTDPGGEEFEILDEMIASPQAPGDLFWKAG